MSHISWNAALKAGWGGFFGAPAALSKQEQDASVQFFEDGVSVAEDLLSDLQRCLTMARDGEIGPPHGPKGEEMLTELMRWAAEAKSMLKGEV